MPIYCIPVRYLAESVAALSGLQATGGQPDCPALWPPYAGYQGEGGPGASQPALRHLQPTTQQLLLLALLSFVAVALVTLLSAVAVALVSSGTALEALLLTGLTFLNLLLSRVAFGALMFF